MVDMSSDVCLHEMFRAQARKTPDKTAILSRTEKITYRHLDEMSDRLAARLLKEGVTTDSCVGILMDRCNEYALAYIGIHKAGGAYEPLDPAYPESMLDDVLKDSKPSVVVCKRAFVGRLPPTQKVILLDSFDFEPNELTPEDREALGKVNKTDLDALAYVVYSSGTTGKPKGIACPHRGAVFSYKWRHQNVPYSDAYDEVEACNVFFVWEMLRPLLQGRTLCVIPDDVIYDPPQLSEFVADMKVTRMLFTPSLLEAVLDCKSIPFETLTQRLRHLTCIVLCGEVVTVALQERTKAALPNTAIWNLYSVSECHDVAALDLSDGDYGTRKYCPVGKLFVGVEAHVFDENLQPKPLGDEGELYVAGPTLAREYIGLGDLTAQRFPTVDGKRMYKTGDRARVLPNRELEILGRCDSMVKIRGYSVELRAIEAAIMTMTDMVTSCVVTVQGEEGTDKFVIAYVVLKEGVSCRKVRLALKPKLPHYMVPAYFIQLDELPTHEVSGKLDKKRLPSVEESSPKNAGAAKKQAQSSEVGDCTLPRTKLEEDLERVWCEVMAMQQIDVVYDSFFDIGGHSLLAAKLVQKIKTQLQRDVGVVDLFTHSTIEKLAVFLGGADDMGSPGRALARVNLHNEVETFDVSKAVNDISMRAFWRSINYSKVKARSVLITGSTGFLGAFILYELLKHPDIDVVYCIVRDAMDEKTTVQDRVRQSLDSRGLWQEDFEHKTQVFSGDASLHHLGLADDDYAALSTGVDLVIHCAALVNLVYPYEGLRSANVLGTRNMIEFALFGKVKKFGYISTNGIFPDGVTNGEEDADTSQFPALLTNGYSQSKWVAEELVKRARDGGLPCVIFRPGNMGGSSGVHADGSKAWNHSDFNYLMLSGCIELGAAPDVDGWEMEMTPVDVASHAIIKILFDNTALGKNYHVTNSGNCRTASRYFDVVRNLGYPLEKLSYADWHARLSASPKPSLQKLKSACVATTAGSLKALSTFCNKAFAAKCHDAHVDIPTISGAIMTEYVHDWQQAGVIAPPVAPGRPLARKVAVVIGASSGIGNAIARYLSEAGALVGLGGRRLDRLNELATQLRAKSGAKACAFQVDVTKRQEVKDFVASCEKELGPVDILVHNAGVMHYTLLKNLQEDQWEKEVDVNCKGLLHGIGAVLPGMTARKAGHIVATSSDAGRKVFPGLSVYSGTKFFVEAVCQGLRLETAETGICVTTIQPGDCKTELSTLTTDEEARAQYAQSSDDRQYWLDPEDVARSVLFAVTAPQHVGVNEILVEPRGAPA